LDIVLLKADQKEMMEFRKNKKIFFFMIRRFF
jgi:hypothetical protein